MAGFTMVAVAGRVGVVGDVSHRLSTLLDTSRLVPDFLFKDMSMTKVQVC